MNTSDCELSDSCLNEGARTPDLSSFDNSWYSPGRPLLIQAAWFCIGLPVLRFAMLPFSCVRAFILRLFGARIGDKVVLKPGIRVKYPWLLSIGHGTWIGEDVWIDNLAEVIIGDNVCISQGAYLCTGNHDWADPAFGLVVDGIRIECGAWVGARTIVCPGVIVGNCAVASAGSVVTKNIQAYEIHAGNPARLVRIRRLKDRTASPAAY